MDAAPGGAEVGLNSARGPFEITRTFAAASLDLLDAANTHGRVRAGMTLDQSTELIRQALLVALFVAAPVLVVGFVVSLVVSLLGAVTQVQEQTLTFIPKIVAMVVCAIVLLPWIGST